MKPVVFGPPCYLSRLQYMHTHSPTRKHTVTDIIYLCIILYFPGLSKPGVMAINMEVGAAPLQSEKPPSIAEAQHPTPPSGSDAPKEHSPMLPEPQAPRSPLDQTAGKLCVDYHLLMKYKIFIYKKPLPS